MTFPWLPYVPVHLFPLQVYPGLQIQRYEPRVLLPCALTLHTGGEAVHSLISSIEKKQKTKNKNKTRKKLKHKHK